jgi:hypothetical protein
MHKRRYNDNPSATVLFQITDVFVELATSYNSYLLAAKAYIYRIIRDQHSAATDERSAQARD